MFPYIFILSLFLLGFSVKKKKQKTFFYLCCICMLLTVALRAYVVGTDTMNNILDFMDAKDDRHPTEPLWDGYVLLMSSLTNSYPLYLSVTALLTLLPLYFLVYKKSEFALLSLFVYFILPSDQGFIFVMTGMRQAMAVSFVLLMFYAFENKKWLLVAIFATVAFFIHNSSIISLVGLFFASFVKLKQKTVTILIIVSVFFMVFSFSMKDVFSIIERTSLIHLTFIEDYSTYADYLANEYTLTFFGTLNLVLPFVLMSTLILRNTKVLDSLYARLYLFGAVFMIIFSGVPMIGRYFMYFIVLEMYLIPQIYFSKEYKYNKVFCLTILTYQTIILFLYLYLNYSHGLDYNVRRVTPYYFFFDSGLRYFI